MTPGDRGVVLPIEVEEFLSWMVAEKGRAVNTVAAYRRDLTAYCAWLASRDLSVLDVTHPQLVKTYGRYLMMSCCWLLICDGFRHMPRRPRSHEPAGRH